MATGIALIALGPVVPRSASSADPSPSVRLLVPAYFYPTGDGLKAWKKLIDSSARAPIVAIVNPDSGPGKRVDDNYAEVFRLARGTKITLIGYVTLSYGKRPLSAVKGDIDSWLQFYPNVRGIFFDEQPGQPDQVAFATECFAYAKSRIDKALFVTNPGVVCAQAYLAPRDAPVACLFEHETGFDKYALPDWADRLDADRFAVLLYHVATSADMQKALREAVRKRAGYVYITDAAASMPWGRLPAFWDDEVSAIQQVNTSSASVKTK